MVSTHDATTVANNRIEGVRYNIVQRLFFKATITTKTTTTTTTSIQKRTLLLLRHESFNVGQTAKFVAVAAAA